MGRYGSVWSVPFSHSPVGPVVGWAYFVSGMLAARDEGSVLVLRATFWSTSRRPWARKVPVNAGLEWAFVVV